ncbi:four helix bundle protein [Pseudidiomarina sp. E22-M8]|uniref:four helix bundle protein n=1 Tax=Pseudidiomarina sp. E22-M8 TaxID=3424768 RepID=UPI00403CD1C3
MYKDLQVYQTAMELCVMVYGITEYYPRFETFGLVSQMRRSAVSIPSNIAEGSGRRFFKEQLRFYYIARGSIAELESQLELSRRLGYISKNCTTST